MKLKLSNCNLRVPKMMSLVIKRVQLMHNESTFDVLKISDKNIHRFGSAGVVNM